MECGEKRGGVVFQDTTLKSILLACIYLFSFTSFFRIKLCIYKKKQHQFLVCTLTVFYLLMSNLANNSLKTQVAPIT